MKKFVCRLLLPLLAVFALALPVPATVTKAVIMKTASGVAQRATTDTTIFTRKITIQSAVGNAATVYVGDSSVSSTNFYASLGAGQGYTVTVSRFLDQQGDQFRLADFYVLGTNPDLISITYELQE